MAGSRIFRGVQFSNSTRAGGQDLAYNARKTGL